MKKQALAPILKKMDVGDKHEYPLRQFSSVKTTMERIQVETRNDKIAKKFSYKTLEKSIMVTRIS